MDLTYHAKNTGFLRTYQRKKEIITNGLWDISYLFLPQTHNIKITFICEQKSQINTLICLLLLFYFSVYRKINHPKNSESICFLNCHRVEST